MREHGYCMIETIRDVIRADITECDDVLHPFVSHLGSETRSPASIEGAWKVTVRVQRMHGGAPLRI